MSIENKGIPTEEIENIYNALSKNEELQKVKETIEKRESMEGQEKLEAYLGYLVSWKNEIKRKQDAVKEKFEEIFIKNKIGGFYQPIPEDKRDVGFRGSDTLFSSLAEKLNEIQSERNLWTEKVSSTIYNSLYIPEDTYYPHDNPKVAEQYFFAPSGGNEHLVKLIEDLGLNKYEYPTVAIPKKILAGELPLYEKEQNEYSLMEKWLRIKDDEYVVESVHYQEDEGDFRSGNHHGKEYDTYKEAMKSFITNEFLNEDYS
jgi:hypothetical protein